MPKVARTGGLRRPGRRHAYERRRENIVAFRGRMQNAPPSNAGEE